MRQALSLVFVLLLAGCGSLGDLGGLGDILGSTSSDDASDVRGTVNRVDPNSRTIEINTSYINNLRDERSGSDDIHPA